MIFFYISIKEEANGVGKSKIINYTLHLKEHTTSEKPIFASTCISIKKKQTWSLF